MISAITTRRLQNEYKTYLVERQFSYRIYPKDVIVEMVGIVIGPKDCPYADGIFLFDIDCKNTYPMNPPAVKIMTTNRGKTRFNPNLYSCGKVCLSTLGTWGEKTYTSALTIEQILRTIQSIMHEKPVENEPGVLYDKALNDKYCQKIRHETIRIAILQSLDDIINKKEYCKVAYDKEIFEYYIKLIPSLIEECHKNRHLDGQKFYMNRFESSCNGMDGTFNYAQLCKDLEIMLDKLVNTMKEF